MNIVQKYGCFNLVHILLILWTVYISNIAKIRQTLQWTPQVAPEEGVKRLIEWVQATYLS